MADNATAPAQLQLIPRTIQMPPLSIRAEVVPPAVEDESREVDLVFTTGAGVRRMDYFSGKEYIETLSLDPSHVRLGRLNQGAPLLDSHNAYSVADVLGTTVPGTASLEKKRGTVRVRFSKRESVTPIWQDVRDQIVRDISIGYRVHKFEEAQGKGDALPVRRAVDWEPFEVSMVPIPADAGARVRGEQPSDANHCEIVTAPARGDEAQPTLPAEPAKETTMTEERKDTAPTPTQAVPQDQIAAAVAAERERAELISQTCELAGVPAEFARTLISEGLTLAQAQRRVFQAKKEQADAGGPEPVAAVKITRDAIETVRAGMAEAILHRVNPARELPEHAREYRAMGLLRMAEAYLEAKHVRTRGLSRGDLASLAMGLDSRGGGMMTTSDFPYLLADVAGKQLRQVYAEAPQNFSPFSRRVNVPDFKETKRIALGEVSGLEEILEHGEVKTGTVGEGQEKFALKSYGKKFAITRKALINDDLDAFSRIPLMIGRAVRNLESDVVWGIITANAALADSVALFEAATHANYTSSGTAISVDSIGVGRKAMRVQKGLGGSTYLNIEPAFLIVPAAKETIAQQFVSAIVANAGGSVNPFAGKLQVIVQPRLDVNSATAWYLAAEPGQVDIIEYAYLEGEAGPRIESRIGFDVDGIEIKVGHDFAAKAIDYRGLYKNAGA